MLLLLYSCTFNVPGTLRNEKLLFWLLLYTVPSLILNCILAMAYEK